jgi:FO synthase
MNGMLESRLERGDRLTELELMQAGTSFRLARLMEFSVARTVQGFGHAVGYSRKVFVPLTQLCRDVCHYCTFAQAPSRLDAPYLTPEQVLEIARAGKAADCKEILFTLGDKPELRYAAAKDALARLGFATTLQYLESVAGLAYRETGLLPHLNPGVMDREDLVRLRAVSVSMGIMLESTSERLAERGGVHFGSPDKVPALRLETIRLAGELRIPFTSGLLIGIGETRAERIQSLLALRDLHDRYGHIQEIIIQNFRAKPKTKMAGAAEPGLEELQWTVAMARLTFGSNMSIQAPPNLQTGALAPIIDAGINDWGGVSPVTPDHVNPEAPWPQLQFLAAETAKADRVLVERLAITPRYAREPTRWLDDEFAPAVRRSVDGEGYRREDDWFAGSGKGVPQAVQSPVIHGAASEVSRIIDRAANGNELSEQQVSTLFASRGRQFDVVTSAADALRRETVGDTVTYVVNRNINYTNICLYHCTFCAFAKASGAKDLRGPAYKLDFQEIARRAVEARISGATEVCLQGGIHPKFTGSTYLDIVAAVKASTPEMHVHAFSPLEISHGAATLGLPLDEYLSRLKAAGLSTLPGTAAEILDDEVRQVICPDKLNTQEWLDVVRAAHGVGLRTTATIMFGHVDHYGHWARHLLRIRKLQVETGGFTEFVPLPFVHMEAPMWRHGKSRSGPTWREAVLMHAVARLVFHRQIDNIQTSWVKMGVSGAVRCLQSGANDLGGTLMNESITRAAGGEHGQEVDAGRMVDIVAAMGRYARQRTTLYGSPAHSSAGTVDTAAPSRPPDDIRGDVQWVAPDDVPALPPRRTGWIPIHPAA